MKTHEHKKQIFGQFSWRLASKEVESFVAATAGHLGPVTFDQGAGYSQPSNWCHTKMMGLEEVISHFHFGLAKSVRRNVLSAKGFPTCPRLNPYRPLAAPYIIGLMKVPLGFVRVVSIQASSKNPTVSLQSAVRKRVETKVDFNVLYLDPD